MVEHPGGALLAKAGLPRLALGFVGDTAEFAVFDDGVTAAKVLWTESAVMCGARIGWLQAENLGEIVAHEPSVRRSQMVNVNCVLHQQLPVRAHGIFVSAGQNRAPGFILVEDHVEILARAREIVFEALGLPAEAGKKPPAVALSTHLIEPHLRALEARPVRVLAGNAVQPALVVVAPIVVEANECLGVAFGMAAYHGAAVPAAVVKQTNSSVAAAHDDERPSADTAREEVARLRHFALVARIEPGAIENAALLAFEQIRVAINPGAEAENSLVGVVVEWCQRAISLNCCSVHVPSGPIGSTIIIASPSAHSSADSFASLMILPHLSLSNLMVAASCSGEPIIGS